jgi:hypothetical protein
VRFLIRAGGTDAPALAAELAAAGIAFEEVGIYRPSLESVFRVVTGNRPH